MGKYRKILVAVDGSVSSIHALRESFKLAEQEKSWTTAVAVIPPYLGDLETTAVGNIMDAVRKPYEEALAEAKRLADAAKIMLRTTCEEGEAYERIVDLADAGNFYIIVMGRRGIGSVDRALVGSVTARVGQFIKLSQRDPKWSFKTIGNSTSTIGAYGCTITCISMASSWFDCFKDPAWMAKNLRFQNDLVIWQSIDEKTCFDFEWRFYKYDEPRILEALNNPRKVCLLQVYNRHWVVATKKLPLGYWTADPWSGGSKYYLNSSVSGGTVLKI